MAGIISKSQQALKGAGAQLMVNKMGGMFYKPSGQGYSGTPVNSLKSTANQPMVNRHVMAAPGPAPVPAPKAPPPPPPEPTPPPQPPVPVEPPHEIIAPPGGQPPDEKDDSLKGLRDSMGMLSASAEGEVPGESTIERMLSGSSTLRPLAYRTLPQDTSALAGLRRVY